MKRKVRVLLVAALAVVVSLTLSACGNVFKQYEKNISELRVDIYKGETDAFKAEAYTGSREEPFNIDGHAAERRSFTVIKIEPKEYQETAVYSYAANINGVDFTGNLAKHPFGKTYSVDIAEQCNASSITLTVTEQGKAAVTVELASVKTDDMIGESKALEIASNKLKKQIDSLKTGKTLNAEIYIRFLENPIDLTGGYFWYVAFVSDTQIVYAVLIDAVNMNISAIRD